MKTISLATMVILCASFFTTARAKAVNPFSAIGYLFGDRIQREIGVPVGIINSLVGWTYIEKGRC